MAARALVAAVLTGSVLLADWGDYRPLPGTDTYRRYCAFCHDDGTVGAPILGDAPAWTGRLDKALEGLTDSAWNGHSAMPARSIRTELTREQVRDAVRYMLFQLPGTSFPEMPKARDCGETNAQSGKGRHPPPC